jgi:ketosteroid isomerase-like protein
VSQENLEIVRRFLQRYAKQDVEAALQDVDPEAMLDWSDSDALDSGVYKGRAAWSAFLRGRDEALSERRFEPDELLAPAADTVVLIGRLRERGRVSGAVVETRGGAVWTLRDGKITGLKIYQSPADALKAVGLEA